MEKFDINHISPEQFEFVQRDEKIHDTKFETKAIGYFGDAVRRFSKNKSSVVAFFILSLIILCAIFIPVFSPRDVEYMDIRLKELSPRVPVLEKLGVCTGYRTYTVREDSIVSATDDNYDPVKVAKKEQYDTAFIVSRGEPQLVTSGSEYYLVEIKYDVYGYLAQPYVKNVVTSDELEKLLAIDGAVLEIKSVIGSGEKAEYNVLVDPSKSDGFDDNTYFLFGTDTSGRDLWVRVWAGTRTSLVIGLFVAVVTITVGIIWGSISGYYGGAIDLIMERFCEILGGIPFLVVMTLMKLYFGGKLITVAIGLTLTSWIGTAGMVRTQFYRYKGREYVLASRTLGAKDKRLIFKHILPNGLGPIVTSSILAIPSAIFSESTISYLGIGVTTDVSIGKLLSDGQPYITMFPYLTIAPALIISLLMISFNLFGNGLRDALNPTLRGVE